MTVSELQAGRIAAAALTVIAVLHLTLKVCPGWVLVGESCQAGNRAALNSLDTASRGADLRRVARALQWSFNVKVVALAPIFHYSLRSQGKILGKPLKRIALVWFFLLPILLLKIQTMDRTRK